MTTSIDDIVRGLERFAAGKASELTLAVQAELATTAPKDTGRLRANFIPSAGQPADRHHGIAAGKAASAAGRTAVAAAGAAGSLAPRHIVNALPYAASSNSGDSGREPSGYVQRAIAKAPRGR